MSIAVSAPIPSTTSISGLLAGMRWAGPLTYNFPVSSSYYGSNYSTSYEPTTGFSAANSTQQNVISYVLQNQFASVSGLTFTQSSSSSTVDISFGNSAAPSTAWAYFPSNQQTGGDVWFGSSSGTYANPVIGEYAYRSVIHEIGHALGLKHGHAGINGNSAVLPYATDSTEYSVMTYRSYVGASTTDGYTNADGHYSQSLMMYDIQALQYLYGANFSSNSSNSTYTFNTTTGEMSINGVGQGASSANVVFRTVWDGNGIDTYNLSNYSTNLNISLVPGSYSNFGTQLALLHYSGSHVASGNIYNAMQYNGDIRSLIENAIGGSGNDTLTGNIANNYLDGGSGDDNMDGGSGNDVVYGGAGNDNVDGGSGNDTIYGDAGTNTLNGGAGDDYIYYGSSDVIIGGSGYDWVLSADYYGAGANFTLSGLGIEGIQGTATSDRFDATGQTTAITIYGHGGADTMIGGSGNDYIYFDNLDLTSGQVFGGAGYDWVLAWDGLPTRLNLLAMQAEGGYGGNANDTLDATGILTSVTLVGNGGNDQFIGGSGNDYLYIDSLDTSINGGAGYDWVIIWDHANIRINLGASNIEGVQATIGNDYLDATGVMTSVSLIGNAGNDTLIGGNGDDYLYIDSTDTSIDGGAGYDWAIIWDNSNTTVRLASSRIEGVQASGGNDYLDGTGVNANISLIGNGGNDTLIGGNGDDYLYVDHFDTLIRGGAGFDRIYSWDNFGITLDIAAAEAEEFYGIDGADFITGTNATWALNLYGYGGNDQLMGGSNNDSLQGGNGDDILRGNQGNDILSGDSGTDVAIYSGNFADYVITLVSAGVYTIRDNRVGSFDGTDTLYNIEQLKFNDLTFTL